jgi:hypothetical protein
MVDYVTLIRQSGLTIYDPIPMDSPLYIPTGELERLLNAGLRGLSTEGLPLRTRSKVVKIAVCRALGYPVPPSFKKTKPRFMGQNFDAITQKANNLQPWNEPIDPLRRYAIIREVDGVLVFAKVVTGESLALLDKTGTLTGKYQARLILGERLSELVVEEDTLPMRPLVGLAITKGSPTDFPIASSIFPIKEIYERLRSLIGRTFPDAGIDQERNRGAALHRLVCETLGYQIYADDGQFPDIKAEALEVKLQTSSTIDLGLVTPNSIAPLDIPPIEGTQLRHCDCRYALFDAITDGSTVTIRRVYVTTGEAFFARFPQFGGKVRNTKRQIPLPRDFFGGYS